MPETNLAAPVGVRPAVAALVGAALATVRLQHGLVQQDLVDADGRLTQSQISGWERGAVLPTLESAAVYLVAVGRAAERKERAGVRAGR